MKTLKRWIVSYALSCGTFAGIIAGIFIFNKELIWEFAWGVSVFLSIFVAGWLSGED